MMQRYLKLGATGEVKRLLKQVSDLSLGCALSRLRCAPGRADCLT
jgi:hypothetical protein